MRTASNVRVNVFRGVGGFASAPVGAALRAAAGLVLSLCLLGMAYGEAAAQAVGERYRIQPGDTLMISVLEDSGLDAEALVLPDGRISIPVAGTLVAGGRAPEELAAAVRHRLRASFVEPPNVTVAVTSVGVAAEMEEEEAALSEVYVLGEVARPGRYEYDSEKPITVIEALTLAGGPGPFAARKRIQVRERDEAGERMRLFDYEGFEDGLLTAPADLAALSENAVIVVPERGLFE